MRELAEHLTSGKEESVLALRMLEALPAGVLLYDTAGSIRFANDRACSILGLDAKQPQSVSVPELLECMPHEREAPELEGGVLFASVEGHLRQIGFRVRPFSIGESSYHLLMFQDITKRETRRREKQQKLLLSSVTHLLPAMAHEIKNPLAAIQSVVEVLLREIQDEAQRADLKVILEEVARMAFLVDRMGLVNERLVTNGRESDVASAVSRALCLTKRRAEAGSVAMAYEGPSELWLPIHPELFLTIAVNLLNNALDASPPGSTVFVHVGEGAGTLELSVRDSGSGMSRVELERATELFYSTKGSSGIGLALIRDIVERDGGILAITSEEGVGTTVSIRIKRSEP